MTKLTFDSFRFTDLSGSLYGFTNTVSDLQFGIGFQSKLESLPAPIRLIQFACLSAVLGPILCGFVLKRYEDDLFLGWNIIFLIAAVTLVVALIIFLLFATSEPCSWAESRFVSVDQFNLEKKNKVSKMV